MIEDLQRDVHPATKIRNQHFDACFGTGSAGLTNTFDKMLGTAVAQIVTIYRGNDDVIEAHRGDGARQFLWLVGIERIRATVAHIAEGTAAGTDVTHDHEGGRALAKTLVDIGAGRFFTHGVQLVVPQGVLDLVETRGFFRRTELDADPVRLLEFLGRHDLDRDARRLVGATEFLGVLGCHRGLSGLHQDQRLLPQRRKEAQRAAKDYVFSSKRLTVLPQNRVLIHRIQCNSDFSSRPFALLCAFAVDGFISGGNRAPAVRSGAGPIVPALRLC